MKIYELIDKLREIAAVKGQDELEIFVLDDDRSATPIIRLEVSTLNDPDDPDAYNAENTEPVKAVGIHWL